jgi:TetR/AcrR family transcriptional regulator
MGITERKERERKQRKEEIIQAAEKVFFSKGFDQSTMDDIAEQAELSKGTIYLYFKSKDDLHMAVAHQAIILLRSYTSAAAEGEGTALEKLRRMGWACIEFSRTHPDQMKAIMSLEELQPQSISLTATDVQYMIFNESTVGTVIQLVEQGVGEKLIRSDLPASLIAHTLWMSVLSVIRFVTLKEGLFEMLELSPTRLYESHFELVINGIRPMKS